MASTDKPAFTRARPRTPSSAVRSSDRDAFDRHSSGGSTPSPDPTTIYLMTGLASGGWIYWDSDTPDDTDAPSAVTSGTVAVLRSWLE